MKQDDDIYTAELALPVPESQLGNIARSLAGLPLLSGPEQATAARPPVPAWRTALDAAIAADPRRTAGVALRLGVSRPYVSRVITGHMPRAPQAFIDRVLATYLRVQCPHLKVSLAPSECRAYAGRSYGQITVYEVDHWRACRSCPVKAPTVFGLPAEGATATPDTQEAA